MGFKDLFATGSSKKDRNYYPRGIPTASDYHYNGHINHEAGANGRRMSATDKLYMNYGSQSASGPRTMSLTSGSMRDNPQYNGQRAMSMTTGRPFGRATSISSSRQGRPNSVLGLKPPSRTNSINSRTSVNNSNIQRKPSSRANSLTSNSSRNPRYIKTTTTTKEQDTSGRTRSITRTTVEQRGNVKIVRTTKTVITPETGFVEGDPNLLYEGFDADMHGPNNDFGDEDYGHEMEPVAEIEDDILFEEDEEHYEDSYNTQQRSPQEQARATAVGAAAAALGINNQQRKPARAQYQWESPLELSQSFNEKGEQLGSKKSTSNLYKKQNEVRFSDSDVTSPNNNNSKSTSTQIHNHAHAHFTDPANKDEHVYQSYESAGSDALSHNFHSADTKYPDESFSNTNIFASQQIDDLDDKGQNDVSEEGKQDDIYEAPLEDSVSENFDALCKKRLSEIAEVTENYEDTVEFPSSNNSPQRSSTQDCKESENGDLEVDDIIDFDKNLNLVEVTPGAETEDEYVEASETLVPDNSQECLVTDKITSSNEVQEMNKMPNPNITKFDDRAYSDKQKSNVHPDSNTHMTGLSVTAKEKSTAYTSSHLYRNLLGSDHTQPSSNTHSPSKNSIPRFTKENHSLQQKISSDAEGMKRISSAERFLDTGSTSDSSKLKNKPLKSALKQSTTPSIRSANGSISDSTQNIPLRSSMLAQDEISVNSSPKVKLNIGTTNQPSPSISQNHKKELSPDLMYAMAFKAAERKVYGEERSLPMTTSQVNHFDAETMRNTHINSQSSSIDINPEVNFSNVSSSGKSNSNTAYDSNVAKFKTHSLRDISAPAKKDLLAQNALAQEEVKRKKKELKADASKEKKKWQEERNEMLAKMHLNEKGHSKHIGEGVSADPSLSPTKKKLLGFGRKTSIDNTHVGDVSTSSKDSKNPKSEGSKKGGSSLFGIGRKKSVSVVNEYSLQDANDVKDTTNMNSSVAAAIPLSSTSEQVQDAHIEAATISQIKAQRIETADKESKTSKKEKKKGKTMGSMFKKLFDLN